jgi:hypothetical protein
VEEALPEIPLETHGKPPVPVQIAKPLTMDSIVKMTK